MARSRFRRSPDALPPLRLTPRDDAILRDVERLGPCLVDHLRRLHFPSYKTAAERAMKLFHHGYLERRPLPADSGQPAMAHTLAPKGIERLARKGITARTATPSDEPEALAWAVDRADVLVRMIESGRHPGLELPVVQADPPGDGQMPDALVVIDMPARLFRRVLLLDVGHPTDGAHALRARFERWRAWAARPALEIEQTLQRHLDARGISPTPHRARVSIALVMPDEDALDRAAVAAVSCGCGALIYLASIVAIRAATPLDAVWVQARDRASNGGQARRTSVLA